MYRYTYSSGWICLYLGCLGLVNTSIPVDVRNTLNFEYDRVPLIKRAFNRVIRTSIFNKNLSNVYVTKMKPFQMNSSRNDDVGFGPKILHKFDA